MRFSRRMLRYRRVLLMACTGSLLAVGTCSTGTSVDQAGVADVANRTSAVVIGNLIANTVGFLLNNAIVRTIG